MGGGASCLSVLFPTTYVSSFLSSPVDTMPIIWIMKHMNETETDLTCPSCSNAELEWHPNGHMAHCPDCGHEEIL